MAERRLLPVVVLALCAGLAWTQDCERPDTGQQPNPVIPESPTAAGADDAESPAGSPLGDALRADLMRAWEWDAPPLGGAPGPYAGPDGAPEVHSSSVRTPGAPGLQPPVPEAKPANLDPAPPQKQAKAGPDWRTRVKAELARWQKLPWKWWNRAKDPKKLLDWAKEKSLSWLEAASSLAAKVASWVKD